MGQINKKGEIMSMSGRRRRSYAAVASVLLLTLFLGSCYGSNGWVFGPNDTATPVRPGTYCVHTSEPVPTDGVFDQGRRWSATCYQVRIMLVEKTYSVISTDRDGKEATRFARILNRQWDFGRLRGYFPLESCVFTLLGNDCYWSTVAVDSQADKFVVDTPQCASAQPEDGKCSIRSIEEAVSKLGAAPRSTEQFNGSRQLYVRVS